MRMRKTSRIARLGGPVVLIKTGLTLTAFAAAAYSRWLGRKLEAAGVVDSLDGEEFTPDVAAKLRRQKMLTRLIPLLSGGLVVVGVVESERGRSSSGPMAKVIDTISVDKSTLDKVGSKITDRLDKVDLHKITPDFVEERRLPDVVSKLAS